MGRRGGVRRLGADAGMGLRRRGKLCGRSRARGEEPAGGGHQVQRTVGPLVMRGVALSGAPLRPAVRGWRRLLVALTRSRIQAGPTIGRLRWQCDRHTARVTRCQAALSRQNGPVRKEGRPWNRGVLPIDGEAAVEPGCLVTAGAVRANPERHWMTAVWQQAGKALTTAMVCARLEAYGCPVC